MKLYELSAISFSANHFFVNLNVCKRLIVCLKDAKETTDAGFKAGRLKDTKQRLPTKDPSK